MSKSQEKDYREDSYSSTIDWGAIGQSAKFDYKDVVNYLTARTKTARFKAVDARDVHLLISD